MAKRLASIVIVALLLGVWVLAQGPAAPTNVLVNAAAPPSMSCTTTLTDNNSATQVSAAASAAAAGSVICLNAGDFGTQTFSGFTKSPRVTIRSASGISATMLFYAQGSVNGLTFDSLTIPRFEISGASTRNITVSNSTVNGCSLIDTASMNNNNILIDGLTMKNIAHCNTPGNPQGDTGKEGRLAITWSGGPGSNPAGVTVTNSTFGPDTVGFGCADGVETGSYGVVIGPNNRFLNIIQHSASTGGADCSEHVDAIQGYGSSHTTINGNYFSGNEIAWGFYDGENTMTITHNIVTNCNGKVGDLGSITALSFAHNTIKCTAALRIGGINDPSGGTGTVTNNLMQGTGFSSGITSSFGGTYIQNMCSSACSGTSNTIGTPTYTGGSSPATWAGWQLTSGSTGHNGASDGQDFGTNYFGTLF